MGSCLRVKQLGHDNDHSPPSSAEIPLLPLDDFVLWKGTILHLPYQEIFCFHSK